MQIRKDRAVLDSRISVPRKAEGPGNEAVVVYDDPPVYGDEQESSRGLFVMPLVWNSDYPDMFDCMI